jgi:hypothetical protein
MRLSELEMTGSAIVQVAVPVGRNVWVSKEAILHYESSRLIRAEGTSVTQTGPRGLTGILYVVVESLCRENRRVMRVERQKIVNGEIVNRQNWGELEDSALQAA